jgi:hypothetical protein
MTDRQYGVFTILIGLVCGYAAVRRILSPAALTLPSALIQGALVGFGFAIVTIEILARLKATRVNGWVTAYGTGLPSNGMFTRAAHARLFPGPVNIPQEAIYWRTSTDGAGHTLSGAHDYVLHFPPGGLPPAEAFWSLTMADAKERFVDNPLGRYMVNDRSGLVPNPDGSVDIVIGRTAPAGRESNWLPAPEGPFRLWLRAYVPGPTLLDRTYTVPPVVEVPAA